MLTFADYRIDVPPGASGNRRTLCPKCSAGRQHNKTDKCLSVEVQEGVWNCFNCGDGGCLATGWTSDPTQPAQREPAPVTRPVRNAGSSVNPQPLTPDAVKYLKDRGISRETADVCRVQSALWSFRDRSGVPAVGFQYADGWKLRPLQGKAFSQTKGGCHTAWCSGLAEGFQTIIVTEGEMDTLSLYEVGYDGGVSCPAGAPAVGKEGGGRLDFLENSKSVFDSATKIILALDNDEPGINWRTILAEALGVGRCLTVDWPLGCKDANDVLVKHGEAALRRAIDAAKPYPCPGIHYPSEYFDEVDARYRGEVEEFYSTGWDSVDKHLQIAPGSLHILTGIPGSGKSEWLDGLSLNMARLHQWRWAVFSPENHPVARHIEKLAEKHVGKPFLGGYAINRMTNTELDAAMCWIESHFVFFAADEDGLSLERLCVLLKVAAERDHVDGIIIDPWNEIEHSRGDRVSETDYIGAALTMLRNVGRQYGIAMFVAAHPTKMTQDDDGNYRPPTPYDISGSAHWRNKADVCLSMWRPHDAEGKPHSKLYVQKIRHRDCGKLGVVKLAWQRATGKYFDSAHDMLPQGSVAADSRWNKEDGV